MNRNNSSITIHHLSFGFTLIELMVVIFAFVLIIFGLIALVSNVLVSSARQSNLLADSDQARRVAFNLIHELRNAQSSSTGAYALDTAQAQALTFYSNLDGGMEIERVRYYVQNGKLYKGVLKPTGNPLFYNPANEQIYVVQNNLANGQSPLFYYYSRKYDGSVDNYLDQPVDVTEVRFVKLEMKVYNTAGAMGTNFYTVKAGGTMRNLKTNLRKIK